MWITAWTTDVWLSVRCVSTAPQEDQDSVNSERFALFSEQCLSRCDAGESVLGAFEVNFDSVVNCQLCTTESAG